jgi:acyl-CoA synthetase (AMP-forming)/AMP-acid ligase II
MDTRTDNPPAFPQTVLDLLREAGDRPCFEHGARVVTGAGTLSLIRRVAGAMRAAGFRPGAGIALLPGVSPEGFAAMFAAYALGLRVSAIRPGLTPGQFAHVLGEHVLGEHVDAIVLDPDAAPAELIAAADTTPVYSLGPFPGATDLLTHPDDGMPLAPAGQPGDIARITYTSGSTGQPKGCGITYRGMSTDWPWRPDQWTPAIAEIAAGLDRYLLFGTLSSPVVLDYVILSLFHGGVAVIPDEYPQPFFPAVIARHRISGSIMSVPRLYQMMDTLRTDPVDVSTLRALMVSGSPLNPRRFAAALNQLGPVVFQAYGQTEAGALTLLPPSEVARSGETALTSVGRLHPFADISIRDEDNKPVAHGETGEIYVRTPYQTEGYWADPAQTAEVFVDGWVRTRDLGYLDAENFLHLVGRTREVIIVNAMVYYAGPIEQVLARHPDVDQAYVVGAPDERTGEAIHAFVVPVPGRQPDRRELDKLVRTELGDASAPSTITYIPEVIAAASGKPDKRALLARYGTSD